MQLRIQKSAHALTVIYKPKDRLKICVLKLSLSVTIITGVHARNHQ
jgi:hypothetical protein